MLNTIQFADYTSSMKWTLLALLLVSLALAAKLQGSARVSAQDSQSSSDVNFGSALQMYYAAIKNIMPCGYPPQNIPILAPYVLPYYSFDFSNGYYKIDGNLSNLAITGLNDFYFLDFTYNTTTNRTTYDMIFPNIEILGQYMVDFLADLAGFPATMSGKGLLEMKILDYRIVGDFVMATSPNNPSGLFVADFNMHFYFGNFVSNNWNYNWDIAANNFYNEWARAFVLMWVEQIQVQMNQIYAKWVLPGVNGYLENVSMQQMIDFLVQEANTLNSAGCTLA